jgi:hypothetical protein
MKVKEVTVLVCKKVSKDFQSWTVSHGVTAELDDGESYHEALKALRRQLAHLVNDGLNGKNNSLLIAP